MAPNSLEAEPSLSEIVPNIYIGNLASTKDLQILKKNNITAVVSLVKDPLSFWTKPEFTDNISPGRHLWIECGDSMHQDFLVHFERICDFIDAMLKSNIDAREAEQSSTTVTNTADGGSVIVHCNQGISRSTTAVAAYLMRKEHKERNKVLKTIKKKRNEAMPNNNFMKQLNLWEDMEYRIFEPGDKDRPKRMYKELLAELEKESSRLP
jgi:dual specificity phosphatase 12